MSRRGLTQRMQVAVMRGVARQLLRRLAVEEEEEGRDGWVSGGAVRSWNDLRGGRIRWLDTFT